MTPRQKLRAAREAEAREKRERHQRSNRMLSRRDTIRAIIDMALAKCREEGAQ